MAHVSLPQVPSGQPLRPLAVEEPCCLLNYKATRIALKALGGLLIGAAVGILVAAVFSLSLTFVGPLAAAVGLVIGIVYGFFSEPLSPLAQYRQRTLEQLEEACKSKPVLLDNLSKIKSVAAQNLPTFTQNYELHTLHDRLIRVSEEMRETAPIQNVWQVFLQRLQNCEVQMPDGMIHRLDCGLALDRLQGAVPLYQTRKVEASDPDFDQILQQIYLLEQDCFGRYGTFTPEQLKQNPHFFIAEGFLGGAKRVLGFAYLNEDTNLGTLHFCGVGRLPGAARLGIGETILKEVFKTFPDREFSLQVRESNASAIALYHKFGFQVMGRKDNYYLEPVEGALSMKRPKPALANTG